MDILFFYNFINIKLKYKTSTQVECVQLDMF